MKKLIISSVAGGLLGLLTLRGASCVPAGHVRVLDKFGSVSDQELYPGLNFPVNLLARRVSMDSRTKELKETIQVPTKEGLIAGLDVSILYHLESNKASDIYKQVGVDYAAVIIEPIMRNVTRDVIAGYSSEDLYSPNRERIASEIEDRLRNHYSERGIELENVLLRDVKLPQEVIGAIEQKIKAKQQAEQMQYVLEKETSEAERKKIEAGGITEAQGIISKSLTQEYLQWKYIESLKELVNSQNNTFVIMPYDTKLTPLLPLEKPTSNK